MPAQAGRSQLELSDGGLGRQGAGAVHFLLLATRLACRRCGRCRQHVLLVVRGGGGLGRAVPRGGLRAGALAALRGGRSKGEQPLTSLFAACMHVSEVF